MDVSAIASAATAASQAKTGDAVQLLVLRKALMAQGSAALNLVQSLPQTTNNPPNLGNGVNAFA